MVCSWPVLLLPSQTFDQTFDCSAFGLNTPIYYLAYHMERDGLGEKVLQLQFYLGLAWILGCVTFGMLVLNSKSVGSVFHVT